MRKPSTKRKVTEKDKWESLREGLNNNYPSNSNWEKAVKIFRDRIYSKYFTPIESLIDGNPKKTEEIRKGEGFSIVTVQCALIETFAAFREGAIYNYDKPDNGGIAYEYKAKDCGDLFVRFLNSASISREFFIILINRITNIVMLLLTASCFIHKCVVVLCTKLEQKVIGL